MKRKTLCLLFSLMTVLSLTGCRISPEKALRDTPKENVSQSQGANETETASVESSEGEVWNAKILSKRPIAVMLDNHSGARPQAGIKDAELVIEALAEGNITRYMAFFFEGMPESIGPIRSARPYFLDRAMEFGAIYVHVGGSPQALSDIKKLGIKDIDALNSSNKVFFRKKHKKMPHNLYSTMTTLRNESEKRAFAQESTGTGIGYAMTETVPSGETALYVKLPYRKTDGGYLVSYDYLNDQKVYQRSINGKVHVDEIDQSPITAKNVIIQYVPTKVVDSKGRLDLDLVGEGSGFWLSDGVKVPIHWSKSTRSAQTVYTDSEGRELLLNPGNTWIQIIPKSMTLQWEKI